MNDDDDIDSLLASLASLASLSDVLVGGVPATNSTTNTINNGYVVAVSGGLFLIDRESLKVFSLGACDRTPNLGISDGDRVTYSLSGSLSVYPDMFKKISQGILAKYPLAKISHQSKDFVAWSAIPKGVNNV